MTNEEGWQRFSTAQNEKKKKAEAYLQQLCATVNVARAAKSTIFPIGLATRVKRHREMQAIREVAGWTE